LWSALTAPRNSPASGYNRIDFIELLADSGANMRAKDHSGKNAQDIAEFYGHEAACKFLASHGAK
jgi:ankyrin repeat protein